ncbi:MAG: hypothetical protein ABID38_05775 [Candidatus Diapherotrites archaeon]
MDIKNEKEIYKCLNCGERAATVDTRRSFCPKCKAKEKVDSGIVEEKRAPSAPSEFVVLEMLDIGRKNWCASDLGLYWETPGTRQKTLQRNLREADIALGIKRGILKVVEGDD